jgi:molybdopterin biosynthesis enzyme MoaB
MAALSRYTAGTRDKSLIINLPGSPKAVKECLEAITSVLPHALSLIRN